MTGIIARTLLVTGIVGLFWLRHEWRALCQDKQPEQDVVGDLPNLPSFHSSLLPEGVQQHHA